MRSHDALTDSNRRFAIEIGRFEAGKTVWCTRNAYHLLIILDNKIA